MLVQWVYSVGAFHIVMKVISIMFLVNASLSLEQNGIRNSADNFFFREISNNRSSKAFDDKSFDNKGSFLSETCR